MRITDVLTARAALVLGLALVSTPLRATIVDRIAVIVGDQVITESEIQQRIRLEAFQNDTKTDTTLAARQHAAQELIDWKLVEREMAVGRYLRVDATKKKDLLATYERSDNTDAAGLAQKLSPYGLSLADLEEELARQADLLTFANLRFRPAVQVTDQDIQKYFDTISSGGDKTKQKAQTGALNELRDQIEQKLTAERADKEMDLWLQDQRKRTKIEFLEKDLERSQP